jgi:hypothetical protein
VLNKPHKVHEVKMAAGKSYQIDLVSGNFDSFLRLEDEDGKQLAQDDDGGGFPNARIMFKAPKDGMYRIIATTFDGKTGAYTLTVKKSSEATVAALKAYNDALADFRKDYNPSYQKLLKAFPEAKSDADRGELLKGFGKTIKKLEDRFAKVAKDFPREKGGMQAAQAVEQIGSMVSSAKGQIVAPEGNALRSEYEKAYQTKAENAPELYKKAEAYYAERVKKYAGDPGLVNELKGGLFVLAKLSLGKTAPEIEGEDLDGKKFKLSDYRGKVVVLDFWGNW